MDLLEELRWAKMTLDDKLKFGMPEEEAIKRRELRVKGVLLTAIPKVEKLLEALRSIEKQSQKQCVLNGCTCVRDIALIALTDADN